jgi:hypothetical protein
MHPHCSKITMAAFLLIDKQYLVMKYAKAPENAQMLMSGVGCGGCVRTSGCNKT